VRRPLEALGRVQAIAGQKVVVVDWLDEALTYSMAENLVDLPALQMDGTTSHIDNRSFERSASVIKAT